MRQRDRGQRIRPDAVTIAFTNGQWTQGYVDIGSPYPGIPLGDDPPSLYFTHGGLDLNFQGGTTLTGDARFGAIPLPVSEDPGPQDFLFSVEAALKASFGNPVTLTMTGDTYLSKIHRGAVAVQGLPDAVTVTVTGIAANGSHGPAVSAKAEVAPQKTTTKHKKK